MTTTPGELASTGKLSQIVKTFINTPLDENGYGLVAINADDYVREMYKGTLNQDGAYNAFYNTYLRTNADLDNIVYMNWVNFINKKKLAKYPLSKKIAIDDAKFSELPKRAIRVSTFEPRASTGAEPDEQSVSGSGGCDDESGSGSESESGSGSGSESESESESDEKKEPEEPKPPQQPQSKHHNHNHKVGGGYTERGREDMRVRSAMSRRKLPPSRMNRQAVPQNHLLEMREIEEPGFTLMRLQKGSGTGGGDYEESLPMPDLMALVEYDLDAETAKRRSWIDSIGSSSSTTTTTNKHENLPWGGYRDIRSTITKSPDGEFRFGVSVDTISIQQQPQPQTERGPIITEVDGESREGYVPHHIQMYRDSMKKKNTAGETFEQIDAVNALMAKLRI